jgi:CRP-like cAMP-binding protein
MRGIDQLLTEHPFFVGLDDATLALMAGCAKNHRFAADEYLFREGDPAATFFVVRKGRVALEAHRAAGPTVVIETVDEGEVLGSAWLVPPHRWAFDARAVASTAVVVFDGACLRHSCEEDPRLGYALTLRVAQVLHARLQASRVRLLDLYGTPDASRR